MEEHFCLRGLDSEDGDVYMDVPQCEHEAQVIAYQHLHGGDNQQWYYQDNKIISLMLAPQYCLSVKTVEHNAPVSLSCISNGDNCFNEWTFEENVIKLKTAEKFCIGILHQKLVLQEITENVGNTSWFKETIESSAKPATSCHLRFLPVPHMAKFDSWALENTVQVKQTHNTTYFCTLGWGPGGYSGIQQVNEHKRVAIFSMWNDGHHSVRLVEHGEGVEVSRFGGEGTGFKSMKDVNWEVDQKVSFKVTGNRYYREKEGTGSGEEEGTGNREKEGTGSGKNGGTGNRDSDGTRNSENKVTGNRDDEITGNSVTDEEDVERYSVWVCSGWYRVEDGDWNLMATYERPGVEPFNGHFYSFVEDWDRSPGAEGNKSMRCAEFSEPLLFLPDDQVVRLERAVFTKQTQGADRYGMMKAFAGVKKSPPVFVLSTGGDSVGAVEHYLRTHGYEQCTSQKWKELVL